MVCQTAARGCDSPFSPNTNNATASRYARLIIAALIGVKCSCFPSSLGSSCARAEPSRRAARFRLQSEGDLRGGMGILVL